MFKDTFFFGNNDVTLEISSSHNLGAYTNVSCNMCVYFYFKNVVRAHMERTAYKSVQNIVYTKNCVTTLMEPVPTVVEMAT